MSGVGSSPTLATCETRQVLLADVSGGFPGVLPFRPPYRLARLYECNNLVRDIKLNQKNSCWAKCASIRNFLLSVSISEIQGVVFEKKNSEKLLGYYDVYAFLSFLSAYLK